MLGCWRVTSCLSGQLANRFCCGASGLQTHVNEVQNKKKKKKVVVVGSGWAGLGAAHHLSKQGFEVTVLEAGNDPESRKMVIPDEIGIHGFWYPDRNIFNLVDELDIKPFTNWISSVHYSGEGSEVEFPIFQDLTQLPTPLGPFFYSQFVQLPLQDRLSSLPLMAAVVDFDNSETAWRKYDSLTARELFRQFGCSKRLYQGIFDPLVRVGLFAPAEQCSAAATLGILYYILAHQKDFDFEWCRGTVRDKIFKPWMDYMRTNGCENLRGKRVTDFFYNEETGCISEVVCGREKYTADAVVLAVGISALQDIIKNSAVLSTREEFLKVLNLAGIDILTVKLWLDQKVKILKAVNTCSGFEDSCSWTYFDLNGIHDEYKDNPATILRADVYHANELLPLKDELIVAKVMHQLSKYIDGLENASVVDQEIGRFPKALTHFFPGSYKYMMRGGTSFPNLFMAGDWIITRHGSWLQEKSYVTGLEAANRAVDYLEEGSFAKIIPLEEDEPHIQALRNLNRNLNYLKTQLPWSDYFIS